MVRSFPRPTGLASAKGRVDSVWSEFPILLAPRDTPHYNRPVNPLAYVLTLASSTCFAGASLIFTEISRRVSPLWMNAFKAWVAWALFLLTVTVMGSWIPLPLPVVAALMVSGVLGLAIGDLFLLTAYARMGSARTMILYGFQPLFLGVAGHVFFHQSADRERLLAVIFFVACLFTFSLEKYRREGHWELPGLAAALVGVMFDNAGVVLSRWSFEAVPALDAFQANVWRCAGALLFFLLFGRVREVRLVARWRALKPREKLLAGFSAALGTYLSLALYLSAIKIGHLMTISALGGAGPMISSAMECAYYRKPPSRFLVAALVFFLAGFWILTF